MSRLLASVRVQGVAKACYLDKRKLVQKPPLLVSHVQALEDIVFGVSKAKFSDYDRVCAGFFCFAAYARARYSDAQASASLNNRESRPLVDFFEAKKRLNFASKQPLRAQRKK